MARWFVLPLALLLAIAALLFFMANQQMADIDLYVVEFALPIGVLIPLTLFVGFVVAVSLRSPVSLDVIRDRNSLYRLTDDGHVDNVYTVRILNKSERERGFVLEARGGSPLTLLPGGREYRVPSGAVYSVPMRVRRAAYEPPGPETITFTVRAVDDASVQSDTEARFLAPTR